ncbi:MAG: flavin-containing monooxygenase [Frankiales bacterium]|nr:flavin-containing monooxygenase [Frankiales bacterium]
MLPYGVNVRSHDSLPRTAVIGAGSSGMVALKALAEAGVPVTCFEKGDRVGGNWVFRNSNGMSASYKSLHINTSRERMEYSDFPMPKHYPDFPHHSHVAEYFDTYVDHFDLRRHIRFSTGVARAARTSDGWELTLDDGTVEQFDALVVANGHHWDPRWPEPAFPGAAEFPGQQLHAHSFEDNSDFPDKRVLVVGMGNSAMDIAVESSWVATATYLSARTPVHVIPKYVFGKPLDQIESAAMARTLPWKARQKLTAAMLKVAVGDYARYGLRRPEHGLLQAHATVSDTILTRLAHGAVTAKPNLSRFEGSTAHFEDGTSAEVDVVVYATGYRISFPFFDEELVSAPDNRISLYQRVFHPTVPDLAFIGLIQPLGAIMPLAEEQGRLVADRLTGRYALPLLAEMQASIAKAQEAIDKRYVGRKRHTIQVDFEAYLHELRQERRRGAARVAATV